MRAVPREPLAAPAMDCCVALAIPRPASARAPWAITPDPLAAVPEVDGGKEPVVPEPATAEAALDDCAEPVVPPEEPVGLLRAEPLAPLAACASVWRVAPLMARPVSARAPEVDIAEAAEAEPFAAGANCPVAPEPLTAEAALAA